MRYSIATLALLIIAAGGVCQTAFAQGKLKTKFSGNPGQVIAGIFLRPAECDSSQAPKVGKLIKTATVTGGPKNGLKPGGAVSRSNRKCKKVIPWRQVNYKIPSGAKSGNVITVVFKTKKGSATRTIKVK